MANVVERPRKRTLRLAGKRPKVSQQTPPATINGTAALPPMPPATINGTGAIQ